MAKKSPRDKVMYMFVELEPFSRSLPYDYYQTLSDLIVSQRDWLEQERHEVVAEYSNVEDAYRRLIVGVDDYQYAKYMITYKRSILGMATIAFDQTLRHPTHGNTEGNVIDYWLHEDAPQELHLSTAFSLLAEQEDEHAARSRLPVARALGVISIKQTHPPLGIPKIMSPVGGTAVIVTTDEADPYNLTKNGELTQIYAVMPLPEA